MKVPFSSQFGLAAGPVVRRDAAGSAPGLPADRGRSTARRDTPRRATALRRALPRAFAVALVGALIAGLLPAQAAANSYDVYACYAGQGSYLNPGDSATSWTLSNNNGTNFYLPYDQCGSGGPNGFGVISRSGYIAPAGDYGEVSFTAPAGLHIRRVQLWRDLYDYGVGSGGTSQRNYAWNTADGQLPGAGDEFDGSANVTYGEAGSGDDTDHGIVSSNYLDVNLASALPGTYAYSVGCGFANGCTTGGHAPASPSGPDTILNIYGAIVSIEDDEPPTMNLGATGLLDGSPQSGVVPLTINASAIAGIARLEVYAGGASTPAVSEDFTRTAHCQFWQAVPCQNLLAYEYPVDTTQLPNGRYYITVKAYDPAGNVVAVSSSAPVRIANLPPRIPNGAPCPGEELAARVDGRTGPVVIGYGRRALLTGVLRCATRAMGGARLRISGAGIRASTVTRPNGTFSYRLPAGHNRTLTVTYTAYSTDARPAARARVSVAVRPSMRLAISPRRTSDGGTIAWRGRIRGGPYPAAGIPLQIQVREGRRWQTFDEISVVDAGRFRYRYTFERTTQPTTYAFRVALPSGGAVGYPYAAAASNVVRVRVS